MKYCRGLFPPSKEKTNPPQNQLSINCLEEKKQILPFTHIDVHYTSIILSSSEL